MATLVVCGVAQLFQSHALGLALRSGLNAVDGLVDGAVVDQLGTGTGAQQRGFVEHVGQIGTGEARVRTATMCRSTSGTNGLPLACTLRIASRLPDQGRPRPPDGRIDPDAAERGQARRAVGGGDDDEVGVVVETIHLDEQLVQRLLALVWPPPMPEPRLRPTASISSIR